MRNLYGPKIKPSVYSLSVSSGGTGRMNISEAADALQLVRNGSKGQPNGPVALGPDAQIDESRIPVIAGTNKVNLSGSFAMAASASVVWTITDYDSFKTYDLTTSAGSISRSGDAITFTAPGVNGNVDVTVAGRAITVSVTDSVPTTPSITSPGSGSTGIAPTVTFTGSAFAYSGNVDTHAASDWQVATDSSFTNIVASVSGDTANKTTWTPGNLPLNTTLYARVKYKGASGVYSAWSATTNFVTRSTQFSGVEEAKLVAADKAANDFFSNTSNGGIAASADGSRVVIGAVKKAGESGIIYVFVRNGSTWAQEQKITGLNNAGNGFNVDMTDDGTRFITGFDPSAVSISASAQIYIRNTSNNVWSLEQSLNVGSNTTNVTFAAIAGDGTRAFVGRRWENKVYVFLRNITTGAWILEATLTGTDSVIGHSFGTCISSNVDGTRIVVGSSNAAGGTNLAGSVYVFVRSGVTWTQEQKIDNPAPTNNALFGYVADITDDGSRIVVGAYSSTTSASAAGQVFIFLRTGTTWTLEQQIAPPVPAANINFGFAVSIDSSGNNIVIGCRADNSTKGSVYVFSRSGLSWSLALKLVPSDNVSGDYAGSQAVITRDGGRVFVGAGQASPGGTSFAGAAYVFA